MNSDLRNPLRRKNKHHRLWVLTACSLMSHSGDHSQPQFLCRRREAPRSLACAEGFGGRVHARCLVWDEVLGFESKMSTAVVPPRWGDSDSDIEVLSWRNASYYWPERDVSQARRRRGSGFSFSVFLPFPCGIDRVSPHPLRVRRVSSVRVDSSLSSFCPCSGTFCSPHTDPG